MIISASRPLVEISEYPDSGKVGISHPRKIFRLADAARVLGRRMTEIVNLFDAERKQDEGDPPGYEVPYARLGPLARRRPTSG